MALYFFNLVSPKGYEADDVGSDCANVEAAYLEAHAAAIEISAEMIRCQTDPTRCQFEITDELGRFVIELPFSEVIRPRATSPGNKVVESLIKAQLQRSCKLRGELLEEIENSRLAVAACRATLARSRTFKLRSG